MNIKNILSLLAVVAIGAGSILVRPPPESAAMQPAVGSESVPAPHGYDIIALHAVASDPASSGDIKAGRAIYTQTSIVCHAANGNGALPGVSNFSSEDGPLGKSDAELAKSIDKGLATPGAVLSMPAKGGTPSLTNDDVRALIAYLRAEFGGS